MADVTYHVYRGNTPTDVGKTRIAGCIASDSEKHPHGRGEDCFLSATMRAVLETPPRTWGRRFPETAPAYDDRNTPTDVGKTVPSWLTVPLSQKHPHGRGEDRSGD